jgi:hypothetical protein
MRPQALAGSATYFRRLPIALVALVLTLPLLEIGSPLATAQLPGVPVQGSVQHVYHAGAPGGIPSTAIPDCIGPDDPAGCYAGEKLVLQATRVGQKGLEPTIGIHPDGTALFAGSTIVADTEFAWGGAKTDARRSTDGGLTWTSVQPAVPGQGGERIPPVNADPMIYVDTTTGRFFTFDLLGACNWLSFSNDKGQTWTHNPLACGDIPVDHQTIVAAKPRTLPAHPLYPNFLYYCTNRVIESACGRSMDGGITWQRSGLPAYGPSDACRGLHGHLESDPEGRIFVPTSQTCGRPWVSVSEDDGRTWNKYQVSSMTSAVVHTSIASDSAGNLYYVWVNNDNGIILPYLSTSTNHGQTWSAPRMIAPPGVLQANFPVVAGGAPGEIAISFPSTTGTGSNRPWSQTVVVTEDALGANPVFLSATANPATDPIHRGACTGRCGGLWDFIDIQISSAGEAWVATSDDCIGTCNTGQASAAHAGDGIAVRQIGGPLLRTPPSGG